DANGKAVLLFKTKNSLFEGNLVTDVKDQWSGGFRFEGGDHDITIRRNTLYANLGPAIRIDNKGIDGANYNFAITNNNIYGNGLNSLKEGLLVIASQYVGPLNATNNWWGSASGPGGDGLGTGDRVYAQGNAVTFSPWATTPFSNISPLAY